VIPRTPAPVSESGLSTARWPVVSDRVFSAAIVSAMCAAGLAIRLFRLDSLPAEMWGDVTAHYYLAGKILSGFPFVDYEFGGDGPLFSYLAAAVAEVIGLSFYSLKLTSALIGTALIPAVYFYAEALFQSRRIGYIAAFLAVVTFWTISFSRQAKPYILVPLFVALTLAFALKRKPVLVGIVAGLGVYAQASFWGMSLLLLAMPLALGVAGFVALPVLITFAINPSSLVGSGSYLGAKLHVAGSPMDTVATVLDNLWKNALSFNIAGDQTFRQNIPGHPHLDVVSGLFFLLGLGLLGYRAVRTTDRSLALWFFAPLLLLQVPLLADQVPSDTPNMGRLTCLLPMTLAAVAFAVDWLVSRLCSLLSGRVFDSRLVAGGAGGVLLAAIAAVNIINYFGVYPHGLPNDNTPFDLVIAQHMDRSPPTTTSILVGCCWGDETQPETAAVWDRAAPGHRPVIVATVADAMATIRKLPQGSQVAVYLDPQFPLPRVLPLRHQRSDILVSRGWLVAREVTGRSAGRP
jgi:hypothetical protein